MLFYSWNDRKSDRELPKNSGHQTVKSNGALSKLQLLFLYEYFLVSADQCSRKLFRQKQFLLKQKKCSKMLYILMHCIVQSKRVLVFCFRSCHGRFYITPLRSYSSVEVIQLMIALDN